MRAPTGPFYLSDGLGDRRVLLDPRQGFVEELDLRPPLGEAPGGHAVIQVQAARMNAARGVTAFVFRAERTETGVRVTSEHPRGLRLSTLLEHLEREPGRVPAASVLAITRALARAVAVVHQLRGNLAHGAICPEHVVLTVDGSVALTDVALGGALDALGYSRERLSSTFGLVLPIGTGRPRFDQADDVAQLAGVILALALGRPLSFADCVSLPELVASVMMPASPENIERAARFRAWIYRALQITRRGAFASAVDAEQTLGRVVGEPDPQRERRLLWTLVRDLTGSAPAQGATRGSRSA